MEPKVAVQLITKIKGVEKTLGELKKLIRLSVEARKAARVHKKPTKNRRRSPVSSYMSW